MPGGKTASGKAVRVTKDGFGWGGISLHKDGFERGRYILHKDDFERGRYILHKDDFERGGRTFTEAIWSGAPHF